VRVGDREGGILRDSSDCRESRSCAVKKYRHATCLYKCDHRDDESPRERCIDEFPFFSCTLEREREGKYDDATIEEISMELLIAATDPI
jgi:hypothetical protein